jgi:DNA-binding transcriptional MerR regulator/effector-binding domain-containing protein
MRGWRKPTENKFRAAHVFQLTLPLLEGVDWLSNVADSRNVPDREPVGAIVYSIGQFSKIVGISVKTLRFYHDEGVLIPSFVDPDSGYRYYGQHDAEKARVVSQLRDLEFALSEIREMLAEYDDEADLLEYLERHRALFQERIRRFRDVVKSLDRIIIREREAQTTMESSEFEVEEKFLEPMLIAGVRMNGKYSGCGKGFAQIGKNLGRFICGKPFCLYYDGEYRPDNADLEACMPVRKPKAEVPGISIRELQGGRCVSLMHKGPYEQLGRSYARVLDYARAKGLEPQLPSREIYHKGPGMIFKGNPQKYLTEIQIMVGD